MKMLKNLHLAISTAVVLPIAFVYGSGNERIFSFFFDFSPHTMDMHSIFRAIMCLYLGMSSMWIVGIFKPAFWKTATITNIIFMAALAAGRLLSLTLDGRPSVILMIGLSGEAVLAVLAYLNLRKYGITS